VREHHITELKEQLIYRARDNIESYKPTKILDIDIQVFLISTIILRNLNNKFLIRKFVSNYGKLMESHFRTDIFVRETRKEILKYFGINKDLEFVEKRQFVKIHMIDYMDIKLDLVKDVSLDKGFVYAPIKVFILAVREAIEKMLFEKIGSMKPYYDNQIINRIVDKLNEKYPKPQEKLTVAKGAIVPESIKELIEKAYKEHHLTHSERIKLGIYLQAQGYDMDYILDIFRQLSDWNEKITKYQLQSLKRYIKQ
jgi:DNA primase large subunit